MNDRTIVFLHVPRATGASLRTPFMKVYGPNGFFRFRPGQRAKSISLLRETPEGQRTALKVDPKAYELIAARNRWDSLLHPGVLRAWDRAETDHSLAGKHGGVDASRAPPDNGGYRDA